MNPRPSIMGSEANGHDFHHVMFVAWHCSLWQRRSQVSSDCPDKDKIPKDQWFKNKGAQTYQNYIKNINESTNKAQDANQCRQVGWSGFHVEASLLNEEYSMAAMKPLSNDMYYPPQWIKFTSVCEQMIKFWKLVWKQWSLLECTRRHVLCSITITALFLQRHNGLTGRIYCRLFATRQIELWWLRHLESNRLLFWIECYCITVPSQESADCVVLLLTPNPCSIVYTCIQRNAVTRC